MAIFVCCEKGFVESVWGDVKLGALFDEAARKRIPCKLVQSRKELEEYKDMYESEYSSLIIISPSEKGIHDRIAEFEDLDIHKIIFSNHSFSINVGTYSCIVTDIKNSTQDTIKYLVDLGCSKITLFGIDRKGGQDALRCSAYERYIASLHTPLVFEGSGKDGLFSLFNECLSKLFQCEEKIDAIITAYDYQAIYLVHILDRLDPDWRNKIKIISFGDMLLSSLVSPSISLVSLAFAESAPVLVSLHRMMFKNNDISRAQIMMGCKLYKRESTEINGADGAVFAEYNVDASGFFKEASYLGKVLTLERLLFKFDSLDFKILYGIYCGTSFPELADSLYLSIGAVKYRAKHYRELLKVDSTESVRDIIRSIIDSEKFNTLISTIEQ